MRNHPSAFSYQQSAINFLPEGKLYEPHSRIAHYASRFLIYHTLPTTMIEYLVHGFTPRVCDVECSLWMKYLF
jgi:hypothetical protein